MSALGHSLRSARATREESRTTWAQPQLALPLIGLVAWVLGVSELHPSAIGDYGLLASANVFFLLGFGALIAGFMLELARHAPRGWLLMLDLVVLIVMIHATVPIVYGGTPEYAWVYKHIGIVAAFSATTAAMTDPDNIYRVAGAVRRRRLDQLARARRRDLVRRLGAARVRAGRRAAAARDFPPADRPIGASPYLAVPLYVGLVAWVGQDYLSPQAFAFLLWLGMVFVILRWLRRRRRRRPAPAGSRACGHAAAPSTAPARRPARARADAALALVAADLLRDRRGAPADARIWSLAGARRADAARPAASAAGCCSLLAAIAIALPGAALRLDLLAIRRPVQRRQPDPERVRFARHPSRRRRGVHRSDRARCWRRRCGCSRWPRVVLRRRSLGRVLIPAVLAFSPFVILGAQSYGGEAIYRVFLFSAPWCALLIAGALVQLRLPKRLRFAGRLRRRLHCDPARGPSGPVRPRGGQRLHRPELNASQWLYAHAPHGSLIVLPDENFPTLQSANYNSYDLQVMPSDPQLGESWLNEGNLPEVNSWISGLGHQDAYLVVSRSMNADARYFGAPLGYDKLVGEIPMEARRLGRLPQRRHDDLQAGRRLTAGGRSGARRRFVDPDHATRVADHDGPRGN